MLLTENVQLPESSIERSAVSSTPTSTAKYNAQPICVCPSSPTRPHFICHGSIAAYNHSAAVHRAASMYRRSAFVYSSNVHIRLVRKLLSVSNTIASIVHRFFSLSFLSGESYLYISGKEFNIKKKDSHLDMKLYNYIKHK